MKSLKEKKKKREWKRRGRRKEFERKNPKGAQRKEREKVGEKFPKPG